MIIIGTVELIDEEAHLIKPFSLFHYSSSSSSFRLSINLSPQGLLLLLLLPLSRMWWGPAPFTPAGAIGYSQSDTPALRQTRKQVSRLRSRTTATPYRPEPKLKAPLWGISEGLFLLFIFSTFFIFIVCCNSMSVKGKKAGLVISWHKSFSILAPWRKGTVMFYCYYGFQWHFSGFIFLNNVNKKFTGVVYTS